MPRFLSKLKRYSDARSLTSNFFSLGAIQFSNYILALVTLPYTAAVLGPQAFGLIGYAAAVMVYFQAIVDYGFNYTATKEIALNRDDPIKVSAITSAILTTKLLLCSLSFLALLFYLWGTDANQEEWALFLISFLFIPATVFFPEWLFQGLERMHNIAIASLTAKTVCTLLIFVFVHDPTDYLWVPILNALGHALSAIIAWLIIRKFGYISHFCAPTISDIKIWLRRSFNVFLNIFSPNLYSNFGTILLAHSHGNSAVALLEISKRLILVSTQWTNLCSRVLFPFLSRKPTAHRYFVLLFLPFLIIVSMILFFFAERIIIVFFGEPYLGAVPLLQITSLTPALYFLTTAYGINFLVPRNLTRPLRNITLISSVLGCIAAILLIPSWAAVGAAISLMVARAISALLFLAYSRHIEK